MPWPLPQGWPGLGDCAFEWPMTPFAGIMMRPPNRFGDRRMSAIALAVLVMFAVATAAFYVAGGLGGPWARDVCSLSRDLCSHPEWAAIATGGVAAIYLVLRAFKF